MISKKYVKYELKKCLSECSDTFKVILLSSITGSIGQLQHEEEIMEIIWKKVGMEDEEVIKSFYQKEQSRSCEFTFANNILWSSYYHIKYAIVEGSLVFVSGNPPVSVSFPIGKEHVKETIDALMVYFEEQKMKFQMHLVTQEQFERLEKLYPEKFQIAYNRDFADYIYLSEKLITLSGKKLHSKRNHINKFKAEHEDWQFELISEANRQECIEMAKKWGTLNGEEGDEDKQNELCVTIHALKNMDKLGLKGGLIRLDGEVIAFSLGEELCEDTFVVHIEKAYPHIQGAYPIINQQFVEHIAANYEYVNREEDTGAEGLRKAKLSYYPIFLQEKGLVTLR